MCFICAFIIGGYMSMAFALISKSQTMPKKSFIYMNHSQRQAHASKDKKS